MSIGIVNDQDFERELEILNITRKNGNEASTEILDINRGRGSDNLEVPDSLRKIIGEDAILNGNDSGKELARAVGISDSSVSAYKNGATSTTTYNEPQANLGSHIQNVKNRITSKARSRLLMAMNSITKEKLEIAKLRDVASVANAMSNVIRNIEPSGETGNQTNFIFYAPKVKEESAFEVINLKEG